MWAAHDDGREPEFVGRLVAMLEGDPTAVLAFSRFDNVDEQGRCVRTSATDWGAIFRRSKFRQIAALVLADDAKTQKANHIYGLMRTVSLRAVGGMARLPAAYSGEDIVALVRLLAHGEFRIDPRVMFHGRVRLPVDRTNQPVLGYIARRLLRPSPGHRGCFLLYFVRLHVYHESVRRVLLREAPLSAAEKAVLYLASYGKEVLMPVRVVPLAVARGFGLLARLRAARRQIVGARPPLSAIMVDGPQWGGVPSV
jgi:hypothetical protein